MQTYLLFKDVRLHSETFEAGEVVEYNGSLDPSIAVAVTDYDGVVRKLSLSNNIYVYDTKEEREEPADSKVGGDQVSETKKIDKHIQKSKKN